MPSWVHIETELASVGGSLWLLWAPQPILAVLGACDD